MPIPSARHGHRLHVVGETVLMFGGFADDTQQDDRGAKEGWQFNISTGQWRLAAPMNSPRAFFGSVVIDRRVYAVGESIETYNIDIDRWQTVVADDVMPRSHFGAAALGNIIYAIGGYPAKHGGMVGYDIARRLVVDAPEPPGFRQGDHFHIVATLGEKMHVVGGLKSDTFEPCAEHWVFDGQRWTTAAPPPVPLWAKFAVIQVIDDSMFVFCEGFAYRYRARTDTWTPLARFGQTLVMPASFAIHDFIYVVGGMDANGSSQRAVSIYDVKRDRWIVNASPVTEPDVSKSNESKTAPHAATHTLVISDHGPAWPFGEIW